MQLTAPNTEEHVEIALLLRGVFLDFDNLHYVGEFLLHAFAIFACCAAETAEDESGFFDTAGFDEVTGGVWEEPDDSEEEEEGKDLEGYWEAPDEGGGAVAVEGTAAGTC